MIYMPKPELLIEIAVVRPSGHDAISSGPYNNVEINGQVVMVDHDAGSLAQRTRHLVERYEGMPVVSVVTNEENPQLVTGVSGEFTFRTKQG